MVPPAPGDRSAARAAVDHVLRRPGLILAASTAVAFSLACAPQHALVGAQDPEGQSGQSGAGTGGPGDGQSGRGAGGTGGVNVAPVGSTPGNAGDAPLALPGGGAGDGSVDATSCARCQALPHVKPDAVVDCLNGECAFVQDVCEAGFAHCDGDFSVLGCESDLSDPAHCGQCGSACGDRQVCDVASGNVCSTCFFSAETACRNDCAELPNNPAHCGSCDHACDITQKCSKGACGECGSYHANCGGQNTCDDWLRSEANCGSCGRVCSTVSMMGACTADAECRPLACVAGRADCDANPEECESELDQPGTCGPEYVGTSTTLAQEYTWWALGSDGSWLATKDGTLYKFSGEGDLLWTYSPPRGQIYKVALDTAGFVFVDGEWLFNFHEDTADSGTFVAKLNADGEQIWDRELEPVAGSRVFAGPIAADGSGTVVLAVLPYGSVDVDPTSAVNLQQFTGQWQLLEVDANGAFSWPAAFAACGVNIDALARSAGRTLVVGQTGEGCKLAGKEAPSGSENLAFIASVNPSGSVDRVRWLLGAPTSSGYTNNQGSSVVAYADGSAALVASFQSPLHSESELYLDDFNHRLAVARGDGRFVARFSAELELQWFKAGFWVSSPAVAPDGGLLALFQPEIESVPSPPVHPLLALWRADGSSVWTLPANCYGPDTVGAAGEIFAVRWSAGFIAAGNCDLDPGPEVATVAESFMVTTYRF